MLPNFVPQMSTAEYSKAHHDFNCGLIFGPPPLGRLLFEALQVLIPNIEKSGHQPLNPVATGMIPSKYQKLAGPQNARLIKKIPSAMRKIRSAFPTFVFINSSFNVRRCLTVSNYHFKSAFLHCTAKGLVSFDKILQFKMVGNQFSRLDLSRHHSF